MFENNSPYAELCVNASHWKEDKYLHFSFYSTDDEVILLIKQHIIQAPTINHLDLIFKNFYKPFACLIINHLTDEFWLVRDHFGFEPFYYTIILKEKQKLCIGSNLPDVLSHIKNPEHNTQQMTNVMLDICISGMKYTDETFYNNVFRVRPGCMLQLQLKSKLLIKHYPFWVLKPGTPKIHYASDDDYDAHFAFLLQEAIKSCCQQSTSEIALEFSGGLDSAAICTALNAEGINAHLFMHVGENSDERRYGEQLLRELRSNHMMHYVNADDFDVVAVLNQCVSWFAGGAPYLFFMLAHNVHQAVREQQCKVLLSGFGGDECVSSHAPLGIFSLEVGLKSLWSELKITNQNASSMRQFVQMIGMKYPYLYHTIQRIKSCQSALSRKKAEVLLNRLYHSFQEREEDWLTGPYSHHVRMRIEYSAVIAKHMGFVYQYPLLYPPLVEYCFALPPEQKRRQGQNRLLMRRYIKHHLSSDLFSTHTKCGDILPGTMPKCQKLHKEGQLNILLGELPYKNIYDYIVNQKLVTTDRLFHLNLLRYMFGRE